MSLDFSKYENKVPYVSIKVQANYLKSILKKIDNEKLTTKERIKKEKQADVKANQWAKEQNQKYNANSNKLEEQFWKDCREDIGYNEYLNEKGCKHLENIAWDRGHAYGYQEVYNCLVELEELIYDIVSKGLKAQAQT